MTIDEAITHAREVSSRKFDDRVHCIRCSEFHKQLAEWFEELKFLRQWKSDVMNEFCKYDCNSVGEAIHNGYNKTLDDFVNACKEDISCQTFGLHINGIERISEQLKAGGENEYRSRKVCRLSN